MRSRRVTPSTVLATLALTGAFAGLGVLAAATAGADPEPDPAPAPGQPVFAQPVSGGDAPAAAPAAAPPMVPEIPAEQAHYGSGNGPFGSLRDAWHQAKDPFNFADTPEGQMPVSTVPANAGPAPALPPGYKSINAPGSETAPPAGAGDGPKNYSGGPALPPGYAPLTGPPPPGYSFASGPGAPAASSPGGAAVVPNAPPAPPPYVPRHSPPPPPLLPTDVPPPPPF